MGLTPEQFWNMPPYLFAQKVEGYFNRENRAGYYFRESFALLVNINRKEGSQAITGDEILPLFGEKKRRPPRQGGYMSKAKSAQITQLVEKINQQERNERAAVDLAIQELREVGIDSPPHKGAIENNVDYAKRLVELKEQQMNKVKSTTDANTE